MRDVTGERFGRLIPQWPAGYRLKSNAYWLCLCDCGNIAIVGLNQLGKKANSCGCFRREFRITHGHTRRSFGSKESPEYISWRGMIERCSNPRYEQWKDYGGRGICVCRRWRNSFINFFNDMGSRPRGKTLDRKNNDGNYTPRNCHWATRRQQAKNRRIRKSN